MSLKPDQTRADAKPSPCGNMTKMLGSDNECLNDCPDSDSESESACLSARVGQTPTRHSANSARQFLTLLAIAAVGITGCASDHALTAPSAAFGGSSSLAAGYHVYPATKDQVFPFDVVTARTWLFHSSSRTQCTTSRDHLIIDSSHVSRTATQTIYIADETCGCGQLDGIDANGDQVLGVAFDFGVDCPAPKAAEPGGTCPVGFLMTGEGCKGIQIEQPTVDACFNVDGQNDTVPLGFALTQVGGENNYPPNYCYPFNPVGYTCTRGADHLFYCSKVA